MSIFLKRKMTENRFKLACGKRKNVKWLNVEFILFDRTELTYRILMIPQSDKVNYYLELDNYSKGFVFALCKHNVRKNMLLMCDDVVLF